MTTKASRQRAAKGPYNPVVIIHGGAGSISRTGLTPDLYEKYHASLLAYLESTNAILNGHRAPDHTLLDHSEGVKDNRSHAAANALDAACHAVALMEDDPLFNCGHGAVFTTAGEVEMEASIMVTSLFPDSPHPLPGSVKRTAAVSMVKNTRHPILLAKEVLKMADESDGLGRLGTMHGHLSGTWVETWGREERELERKEKQWFWTRKRWDEHRRGLGLSYSDEDWKKKLESGDDDALKSANTISDHQSNLVNPSQLDDLSNLTDEDLPSQGTVGAVCFDSWGNLAVATSTGGLTNKRPGRIGDTPSVGSGFWAESWEEDVSANEVTPIVNSSSIIRQGNPHNINSSIVHHVVNHISKEIQYWVGDCIPSLSPLRSHTPHPTSLPISSSPLTQHSQPTTISIQPTPYPELSTSPLPSPSSPATSSPPTHHNNPHNHNHNLHKHRYHAIALSGTGNGDSFLRTLATHTTSSILKHSSPNTNTNPTTLQSAITKVSGPNGILQNSAGPRWNKGTGEGEGGIIGIDAIATITTTTTNTSTTVNLPKTNDRDKKGDDDDDDNGKEQEDEVMKLEVQAIPVFDFNCTGMWRAYYEDDPDDKNSNKKRAKVMVFRDEFYG